MTQHAQQDNSMKRDEALCRAFVDAHYAEILAFLRYRTSSFEAAEDLTQETFLRFFRSLSQYEERGKARNYLYTIARRLAIDASRKQSEELPGDDVLFAVADPEILEDATSTRMDVSCALRKLDPELREIALLSFYREFSAPEIAEITGLSVFSVRRRLRRATKALQHFLKEDV